MFRCGIALVFTACARVLGDGQSAGHTYAHPLRTFYFSSQGATATAKSGENTPRSNDDPRLAIESFDGGMSRAAEAREAVAAKRSKIDKEEREQRALRERREAIEAARCAEREGMTGLRNGVLAKARLLKETA